MFRLLGGLALVAALAAALIVAVDGTTTRTLSYDYEQPHAAATCSLEVRAADDEDVPASSRHAKDVCDDHSIVARSTALPASGFLAPNTTGVLVDGAGSGTRALNFRPNIADPNWGLTKAHLDKHLFGSGSFSLRQIDAAGNPDLWRSYMQDLAGRPATAPLKGGIEDVIGTFPKADGSGTFQFGIRIAPGSGDAWDLVTLLTKQ